MALVQSPDRADHRRRALAEQINDRSGSARCERLISLAPDCSEKMLLDAGRHGTFLGHPGRCMPRVADALPRTDTDAGSDFQQGGAEAVPGRVPQLPLGLSARRVAVEAEDEHIAS